jgi:hypothetical protein
MLGSNFYMLDPGNSIPTINKGNNAVNKPN